MVNRYQFPINSMIKVFNKCDKNDSVFNSICIELCEEVVGNEDSEIMSDLLDICFSMLCSDQSNLFAHQSTLRSDESSTRKYYYNTNGEEFVQPRKTEGYRRQMS